MTPRTQLLSSVLAALCITCIKGNVTYVDADVSPTGNTTLADGTALADGTVGYVNPDGGADDLWGLRSFGNGTSILQGGIDEDAPRLRTTITGLTVGESYEIYAYFWGAGGASPSGLWRGRTSLTDDSGDLSGYNTVHFTGSSFLPMTAVTSVSRGDALNLDTLSTADGSGVENGGYFSNTVITEESDRRLYQVSLGSVVVDGTGNVNVYIDDLANTGQGNRTWYDGVGYQAATPPPTGDITYVDATTSTISQWDGQPFSPEPQGNTTIDDNWEVRLFGNSGEVYESNADGPEDAPLLVANLTGLDPNTEYVLYAYFWDASSGNWRLKASAKAADIDDNGTPGTLSDDFLPTNPLTSFAADNNGNGTAIDAKPASPSDFVSAPLLTEGDRTLMVAPLGTAMSDGNGDLVIYIDDFAGQDQPRRTWFDGVGYKAAVTLDPAEDEDQDGLTNGEEATEGTNPYIVDTDGDSFSDAVEVVSGSNPLDAESFPALPGNAIAIAPDGVWTWFNDERAIWHLGKLYSGYVLSNGEYGITQYDPATNTSSHSIISTGISQEQDDHNNPSITVLPDDRLLIVYSKHITDDNFYHRTSLVTEPATITDWGPEVTFDTSVGVNGPNNTYSNTYRLTAESNRIYNFHRNINFNPTITVSDTLGTTWEEPVPFIEVGSGSVRPYPRYCSNNTDRIDLIYTDGHPRDVNNSVYHMFYESDVSGTPGGGSFYKTDGTLIDTFASLPLDHEGGERGSVVYQYSSASWGPEDGPDDWIPSGRGWTWDVHYGADGNPVCTFQVQVDNVMGSGWNNDRIYYYYARWTGTEWQRRFIAQAGRGIYSNEDDYGGGMCIDPDNPNVIYISSNAADPFDLSNINNVPLAANDRYEIYRGVTTDGGLTFTWEAITVDSPADNLRPIVPANHGYDKHAVWFYGTYNSYTNYNTEVIGIFRNELTMLNTTWSPTTATLTWRSVPGATYDITASLDLTDFNIDILSDISSQGSSTSQIVDIPSAALSQGSGFFRVEEQP